MPKFVHAVAACLIVASPAVAQTTASTQAPGQTVQPAKAKLICETEQETGSRLGGKRVCHTAEEWEQIRAETRQNLEKIQQQSTGTPASG